MIPFIKTYRTRSKFKTKKYQGIVRYFDKTPSTIVCPHFWQLNWAYGCNFDCSYCYLKGTFRGNTESRYIPPHEIFSVLDTIFKKLEEPTIFNSGELTDSLVFPNVIEKISDKFEEQTRHKLLLLTKSSNVNFLLKKLRKQTIVSFSINAPVVSKRWEGKAPNPNLRLTAAKQLSDAGYDVRLRVDPIFPIKNWKKHYGSLLSSILSKFEPERITLGTPRGLQKTKIFSKDLSWWKFAFEDNPSEKSGWGMKMANHLRKEIYQSFFNKLNELGFKQPASLCKETIDMWKSLDLNPGIHPKFERCKCNCVW